MLEAVPEEVRKIRELAERLRRDDPLRPIVASILNRAAPPESAQDVLLDVLTNPRRRGWKRTLLACWSLAFVPLTEEQKRVAGIRIGTILNARPGRRLVFLIAAGCLFTYLGFLYILYASIVDSPLNKVREAAAMSLGRLATEDSIDYLVSAMAEMPGQAASGDRTVRIAATKALAGLLPSLPDGGYGRIPQSAIATTCKLLIDDRADTVVAALRLLKSAGGGSAIDSVEKCLKKPRNAVVRSEAEATLAVLNARRSLEMQSERLLRAADTGSEVTESLLRPIVSTDQDPARLLRPTDTDHTEDQQQA